MAFIYSFLLYGFHLFFLSYGFRLFFLLYGFHLFFLIYAYLLLSQDLVRLEDIADALAVLESRFVAHFVFLLAIDAHAQLHDQQVCVCVCVCVRKMMNSLN